MKRRERSRNDANAEPRVLRDSLRQLSDELGLSDPDVVRDVHNLWVEVVGDAVAAHARVAMFREGTLTVAVDAPQWATEVRYLATDVMTGFAARGVALRELHVRVEAGPDAPG